MSDRGLVSFMYSKTRFFVDVRSGGGPWSIDIGVIELARLVRIVQLSARD